MIGNLKLNDALEDWSLGLYFHTVDKMEYDEEGREISNTFCNRLVLGFLLFNIELIWERNEPKRLT